jgi:Pyridoxamine 5'-phosphate oxidase
VRRLPERGAYDRDTVHAILDEGFICHVAFAIDGQPYALPTGYARVGEIIYLHGSSGSRLGLRPGMPLEEVSAKVRRGDPIDDEEDYALPAWAGVLPLALLPGRPVPDARLNPAITVPSYLAGWHIASCVPREESPSQAWQQGCSRRRVCVAGGRRPRARRRPTRR